MNQEPAYFREIWIGLTSLILFPRAFLCRISCNFNRLYDSFKSLSLHNNFCINIYVTWCRNFLLFNIENTFANSPYVEVRKVSESPRKRGWSMKHAVTIQWRRDSTFVGIPVVQFLSHSLRSSEIIFLGLSRNVVWEFGPITVVVVVSLTVDSRLWYGFDGWQYSL